MGYHSRSGLGFVSGTLEIGNSRRIIIYSGGCCPVICWCTYFPTSVLPFHSFFLRISTICSILHIVSCLKILLSCLSPCLLLVVSCSHRTYLTAPSSLVFSIRPGRNSKFNNNSDGEEDEPESEADGKGIWWNLIPFLKLGGWTIN